MADAAERFEVGGVGGGEGVAVVGGGSDKLLPFPAYGNERQIFCLGTVTAHGRHVSALRSNAEKLMKRLL